MTPEEELIQRYFDAFNRHDLEGVMACFHEAPVIIDIKGRRIEGRGAIRLRYEENFASMPDCRCDLGVLMGRSGYGVGESRFHRTRPRYGTVVLETGWK
ncbi:MAG: nuclear transport factor 2 family protein [Candidatus Binataceae bacterium]